MALAIPVYAQETSADKPFSFVVIGHVRGPEDGKLNSMLDELLADVRQLKPDMLILTGDMIWGSVKKALADNKIVTEDWERLDAKLVQLGVPIYRVPGNHDIHDPVTRDIYFKRYGKLPQAVNFPQGRLIFLNSSYVPVGNDPEPRKYIMGQPLDAGQIDFLRRELSKSAQNEHVFVFMHHLLWWDEDAAWWREVHPLLVRSKVRAVFSGDYGPMKFAHMRRDGVDYFRSVVEDDSSPKYLNSLEHLVNMEDRLTAQQFDNFLYVTVKGSQVNVSVQVIAAVSSGKFSPQRWRQVNGPGVPQYNPEHYSKTWTQRVWKTIGTPQRLAALAIISAVCFAGGAVSATIWNRRKTTDRAVESTS